MPSRLSELAERNAVHIGSAVLLMGSWATFANRTHGVRRALLAGLVQGGASALVTFLLKGSLEAMARRLHGTLAFVVPPTVSCSVVLVLLVVAHRLAGTHEVWSTISIPYAASSAYAWIYTAIMVRRRPPP